MVRSASRASAPAEGVLSQEIKFTPNAPPPDPRDVDEPLSFWEQLYEVPEDQWSPGGEKGFKVHLYEGQSGPYIDLITHPFDIEWVKQKFGGGNYRALLNNPGGKIAASIRFSIDGDPRRKQPQSAQNSAAPQQPAADSFQSQVLQIISDGQRRQEQLLQQLIDSRGANPAPVAAIPAIDPNIMLRGVVDMFSGLLTKAQTPQPQMGLLEMVALIEKFRGPGLIEQMKGMRAAGLIPAAGSGNGDLVTQFKQLKEAAEVVGLGEGKGKSLGEAVIEKLPDILDAGGKAMEKYHNIEQTRLATAREVRAIQQNGRPAPLPPQVMPPSSAQPTAPAHSAPPPIAGSTLEVESPTAAQPQSAEAAQAQSDFIKNKVVEQIAGNFTGDQIVDFLDSVDASICDRFTGRSAAEIGMWFANDAILKKAVTLPRFKAAIAEMVEEINSGGAEPEPPAQVN